MFFLTGMEMHFMQTKIEFMLSTYKWVQKIDKIAISILVALSTQLDMVIEFFAKTHINFWNISIKDLF